VHIPKCGGQSIEHMFLADLGLAWKDKPNLLMRKRRNAEQGPPKLGHLIATDYVSCGYIEASLFNAYYKFSIVRNPFNRVQSAYNYLGFRDLVSFSYFVNNIVASNLKNKDGWFWFLRPQVDFILDKNQQLLVNEIFKIENLSDGIATIIERSGLSGQQLLHVNQSSQLGLSSRMLRATKLAIKEKLPLSAIFDRNSKVCDQQTKSRIEQLYAADYEYLGY
jgi:Sulfotransferase family